MKKSFITSMVLLIVSINVFSQFTRENAIELVLTQVVGADSAYINVYASNTNMVAPDSLALDDFTWFQLNYLSNWVFFIDDMPFAHWHHPVRYVCVNSENGQYTTTDKSIYPIKLSTDFELVSSVQYQGYSGPDPLENASSGKSVNTNEPNSNLYAVLITGWKDVREFWNDISNIYCAINQVYGYPKENIFVHYVTGFTTIQGGMDLDGPEIQSEDIDYGAYFDELEHTFYCLGGIEVDNDIPQLLPSDQLFVFFNGHGNVYNQNNQGAYMLLPSSGQLKDTTFARWLSYIECAQMTIVMEPCYSGGFNADILDFENYDVKCENRFVHSACDFTPSAAELWVTHPEPNPFHFTVRFGEFVFYWTAAVRGYYPNFDEPWNIWDEYPTGTFPLEDYFPENMEPPHPGDHNPDLNNDGFVQMEEAFAYADFFDSWSPNGVFERHPEISNHEEYPQEDHVFGFQEDLISLFGLTGEISNTQSVQGNYAIGGPITFEHTPTLTLLPNTNLYFINDFVSINGEDVEVNFTVPANCNLILQNDVTFYGYDNPNSIDIYGDVEFGQNNQFLSHSGNTWEGVNLLNEEANIVIDGATFNKCGISGNPEYLNLDNLDFSNGFIDLQTTNVDLDNSEFYYSNFKNIFGDRTSFVNINNCNFDHSWTNGVYIDTYFSYQIKNCTINNCLNGIKIFNSGTSKTANIYQNLIENNINDGVEIYNSHAYFNLNNIRDNNYNGLSLHDNSFISFYGNEGAHFVSETQRLRDNDMFEIFTDEGSFPEKFKWNAIIDEDNETDGYELIYCETIVSNSKDVKNNYWGTEENFNPEYDFYPYEDYLYLPKFYLEDDEGDSGTDELLFNAAENNFVQGNYTESKNGYQQVIEQYPGSKFAEASIKQLFSVEEYASNDYNSLKQYYRTNPVILTNPDLEKLADFFANKCDIKLENWDDAIGWFENKIQNPESYADSLYAVIDLGNLYLLMEQNGYKSVYHGLLTEHIPVSETQYAEKRDYLLGLLPSDQLSKTMKENIAGMNEGELLQNIPNPFKGSTQIWYKLKNESIVQLNVYNFTGQLIRTINEGTKTKGAHYIDFDATGLKNGIYFYAISINGRITDSRKMTLMK